MLTLPAAWLGVSGCCNCSHPKWKPRTILQCGQLVVFVRSHTTHPAPERQALDRRQHGQWQATPPLPPATYGAHVKKSEECNGVIGTMDSLINQMNERRVCKDIIVDPTSNIHIPSTSDEDTWDMRIGWCTFSSSHSLVREWPPPPTR